MSYFDRVPAQEIIADNHYERYDYIVATKGRNYAWAYIYTRRNFNMKPDKLGFTIKAVQWFSPATGSTMKATYKKKGAVLAFDPPGSPANGNDRVLLLEE